MKLERAAHDPGPLLEFYEAGLSSLGALCERTWHDRLEVIAEGRAARLWNPDGSLHEIELRFATVDAASARDAAREVFPGCPLTFQLAEALRISPLLLERFFLPETTQSRAPDAAVAEKLWRAQFPDTARWQLTAPMTESFHFSLLALVRCEIQAIDQRWSLHRVALSLADGTPDDALAREIGFQETTAAQPPEITWPAIRPENLREHLAAALQRELAGEMNEIRARQENSLRRELERIDDYFENYARELTARAKRGASENSRFKTAERLAAAEAEHERRRLDQLARHEIRVQPHLDALLIVAEKAWQAQLRIDLARQTRTLEASFIPRARRWCSPKQETR